MKCIWQGCENVGKTRRYCTKHYYDARNAGLIKPLKKKTTGYSETKECGSCGAVKHWRKFVLGLDDKNRADECRDCYRTRILAKEEKTSTGSMEDFKAFLNEVLEPNDLD